MTFTDDDLKRLKEELKSIKDKTEPRVMNIYRGDFLDRLLARLEAAEQVAENCICKGLGHSLSRVAWQESKGLMIESKDRESIKRWRKVAGK